MLSHVQRTMPMHAHAHGRWINFGEMGVRHERNGGDNRGVAAQARTAVRAGFHAQLGNDWKSFAWCPLRLHGYKSMLMHVQRRTHMNYSALLEGVSTSLHALE